MTPRVLASDYAARIRARLGVTDSHLTTAEIDEQLPEIEAVVIEKITDYATQTGDPKIYLDSAVVCKAASALCPLLKKKYPIREQGPSGTFETPIDWDKEMERLDQEANRLLSKVKAPTVTPHFQVL